MKMCPQYWFQRCLARREGVLTIGLVSATPSDSCVRSSSCLPLIQGSQVHGKLVFQSRSSAYHPRTVCCSVFLPLEGICPLPGRLQAFCLLHKCVYFSFLQEAFPSQAVLIPTPSFAPSPGPDPPHPCYTLLHCCCLGTR